MNIAKYFRTAFCIKHLQWLLLYFLNLHLFFSTVISQKQAILMWVLLPEFISSSPKTGKNLTKIMLLSLLFALFFSYIISPIFKNKSSHYVSVWVPKNQRQHYLSEPFYSSLAILLQPVNICSKSTIETLEKMQEICSK